MLYLSCSLCKLVSNSKTKFIYQDDFMMIVNCLSCNKPLIVFKEHKPSLNVVEELHMLKVLKKLSGLYSIDKVLDDVSKEMSSIKDHVHWHWVGKKKLI